MSIIFERLIVDTKRRTLGLPGGQVACRIGRGGAVAAGEKREGDGATPVGSWHLRTLFVRADRLPAPATSLPWRYVAPEDGWSDDPADPAYNRPVRHPYPFSAERLWREDGLYDLIVTLNHNSPPVPGAGSAVFLHCTVADRPHTAGCVAIDRDDLWAMLPRLSRDTILDIR